MRAIQLDRLAPPGFLRRALVLYDFQRGFAAKRTTPNLADSHLVLAGKSLRGDVRFARGIVERIAQVNAAAGSLPLYARADGPDRLLHVHVEIRLALPTNDDFQIALAKDLRHLGKTLRFTLAVLIVQ